MTKTCNNCKHKGKCKGCIKIGDGVPTGWIKEQVDKFDKTYEEVQQEYTDLLIGKLKQIIGEGI